MTSHLTDNDDDDHKKCTNKQALANFLNNKSAFLPASQRCRATQLSRAHSPEKNIDIIK